MRIATIVGGIVTAIVDLDMSIDADGLAARGPGSHSVTHPDDTVETVEYEAVYPAPPNGILVASDTADVGFIYENGTFRAPPPPALSRNELIIYAARKRFEVETSGL